MNCVIGLRLSGAAFLLALAAPALAQTAGERFDPQQLRRVALAPAGGGYTTATIRITEGVKSEVTLITASGQTILVRGDACVADGCQTAIFQASIDAPPGHDGQQLVDHYNQAPRWAVAHFADGKVVLQGELIFLGGISDTNLAQYLQSLAHHSARLKAGQP